MSPCLLSNRSLTVAARWEERRSAARDGRRSQRRAGFSLIEVIIGIAMLTALSGVLWTFLIDLRRQKEALSERGAALARQRSAL
jgi:prepilin-type N-terminal cleavage/methylation domain-containing protein